MKIPFRSIFVADKGNVLLAFDLSQAETWCVASLANEDNMFDALNNGDIHCSTAVALFHNQHPKAFTCKHKWQKQTNDDVLCLGECGILITKDERYLAKRYNHASSYRMSYLKAAEIINKDSIITGVAVTNFQSKQYSERWHGYYSIKSWWRRIEDKLGIDRTLITVYGFKRVFYGQWGDELFKEATAFEPQSTVADHCNGAIHPELGIEGGILGIRRALNRTKLNKEVRIVHTAHDSVTLEARREIKDEVIQLAYRNLFRPLVINGHEFTIPVDGEWGERWGELEKIKDLKKAA